MVITVIGIGLIGGSMAISLKENGFADKIIGIDLSAKHLKKALDREIIEEALSLEEALPKSDIIILSTPVDSMLGLLPKVLNLIDNQVLIDVGSTKKQLLKGVENHAKRGRFVATHPMAGTEFSGPEAAIPKLFDGKVCVFCDTDQSDEDAVKKIEKLYESMNMKILELDAQSHDVHTAYISHISHLSSMALALTVLEKEKDEKRIFELASGGFSSTVRLAKSSPDMWTPIFRQNRDNLLDVLDEHINTLARFRSLLIKNDFDTIHKLIEEANIIKKILK